MKAALLKLAGLGAALAVLGFLVAASGLVSVKASSGHWPPTRWFLSFSMARSVSTHSLGTKTPPLDDPDLALRGAGHYETGCRPCHGAPGAPRSEIAREMTPEPPLLLEEVGRWDPEELFYLVKHGVKMTGMPAWPAREREDEVWALVAFLLTLPDLSPDGYRTMAFGDAPGPSVTDHVAVPASLPPTVAGSCARCHGTDGLGRGAGAFPKLAGQKVDYLAASLGAYRRGARHSGIMQPLASALDDAAVREVARYYAEAPPAGPRPAGAPSAAPSAAPASLDRGEAIAREGIPERKVPACVHCHGPSTRTLNGRYPEIAGQHADYLLLQLRLFSEGRRGGTDYGHVMSVVVRGLEEEDMRDVAAWYGSLAPTGPPPTSP